MSTNYYVITGKCENACEHCTAAMEIHLGKSTLGREFVFRGYSEPGQLPNGMTVTDFGSWLRLLDLGEIESEYKEPYTKDELLSLVDVLRKGLRNPLGLVSFRDKDGNYFLDTWFC